MLNIVMWWIGINFLALGVIYGCYKINDSRSKIETAERRFNHDEKKDN